MKLYSIRGGNKGDLENKKYTIGIGISLGNKWFTVDNIIELIKWSLQYSKDKVIVYVADSIHAINLEIRSKISFEKALQKANNMGDKILNDVKLQVDKDFSEKEKINIIYVKWDQIDDENYKKQVEYLKSLYNYNVDFKNTIYDVVKNFTSKEERIFSEKEINHFGDYIIEEFPEVINRVPMANIICDAYTYPFDGELTKLAEQIQKGEKFPEIKKNIMYGEPKVFLEVR